MPKNPTIEQRVKWHLEMPRIVVADRFPISYRTKSKSAIKLASKYRPILASEHGKG